MGAQHTLGPWAVSKAASRRVTSNGVVICNAVLRNSGSAKRGIRHGAKEMAEAEANARLIAAAPALLEVLEDMLSGWRYVRVMHGDLPGVGWDRAEEIATDAISKARGEA